MVQLTASSSFDLESIRDQKTIIYFIIPAQHAEYYGFWTSVFFRSVFNACMRRMPDRRTLPVYVLYDEFGHSTIPSFVSVANTIRGYRVSLSIVLQSLSQLDARYGDDYARSIQGGFNTYLAYSGSDPETASFFEEISGRVIEIQKNKLEEYKEERHEYNLLNADAIRRIGDAQAIMVSANKNPAILETVPFFKNPRLRKVPTRYGAAHITSANAAAPVQKVPLT
jgi:type IV secretion system protein VirD4